MEEVTKFIAILKKYLLALIVVPIITIIVTFFLVRNLPSSYVSQSELATGIVDKTQQYQQQSISNIGILQTDQINQEFNNLITMIKMKRVLDQVSYKLIIHDLTSIEPFRPPSSLVKELNSSARIHAVEVYKEMLAKQQALNLWDKDQNGIYRVLTSMGYDSETIGNKLNVFRSGNSDFITIQYESEDPILSAMVVNTLAGEFVNYYSLLVRTNKVKATRFLGVLMKEKSDSLAKKMGALRAYKIRNRVLNLDEQSKQLYTSITDYDTKKQEAVQNTSSFAGALNEIDRKFSPGERKYLESAISKINQQIVGTKDELSALYEIYYKSDFDEKYKVSIDSLQTQLTQEIAKSSDQYLNNPLATKEALVAKKIDLEVKLDLSRYSINSLESKLNQLNAQFDLLVPKEAEVQSFEMEVDIATKEYMDILGKYNQSSLESAVPVRLSVIQEGMPGLPQPSKKMLLVILSGIIAGFFVLLTFFILYLLDFRVISPDELADKSQIPILGCIQKTNVPSVDLKGIWSHDDHSAELMNLKDQIRSIRYEVENDLKGRILLINSLKPDQGKTFITMSLAFAWLMTNKKVLIIDGNFANPKITSYVDSSIGYIEDFLRGDFMLEAPNGSSAISVFKNKGGDSSLIELAGYDRIRERLHYATTIYDLVIIESASLNSPTQAKEWASFADSIVGIFGYGSTIGKYEKKHILYLKSLGIFVGWIMNRIPQKK